MLYEVIQYYEENGETKIVRLIRIVNETKQCDTVILLEGCDGIYNRLCGDRYEASALIKDLTGKSDDEIEKIFNLMEGIEDAT